ncbi:XTP/dITP diphosphatase [Clostridium sp. LIBA-8841]|uniref:XTP/dITP diphosphatase n=1 Tax=Clostridium sp. LIBA-8841 TaxID=2987530 RepID=UPI002AC58F74|nr:XTP/dITP diphosphatase [Clostridium sp. LIBA-8841]MDZ5255096.1 XTP/dITP diphosphatase [Clostridium sp. LIBA-8841]
MKRFILASNNAHKIKEIKEILKDFDFEILSLKEAGIDIDVEEDGKTFEENSFKKADEIRKYLDSQGECDFIVMADDSGLEVEYLNGEPGIYSARYAGEHGNDAKNNEKLLNELKGIKEENRKANFICVIVAVTDKGEKIVAEGKSYGIILEELSGNEGFGYDPLFFVPEYKKTFAEMTSDEKNAISHRGRALEKLKSKLKDLLK